VERRSAEDLDELLLGAPRRYTSTEAAERAGVPIERARRYWRALGFANTGTAIAFTDADVAALRALVTLVGDGVLDEEQAVALTRALGTSTYRLAGWQVDVAVDLLSRGTGRRETVSVAAAYAVAERLLPELEPLLLHAWRRQLAAAVDRVVSDDDTMVDAAHLTVCFADLVGFTRLSRRLEQRELAAVVERFEQVGADLITGAGARMVKTLGDEILFVASTPDAAAEAAMLLLETFGGEDPVPELRVGLATGLVIARMGDVFGTTVNLASRLTALARPGSALVDEATAEDLAGNRAFATFPLAERALRGLGTVVPAVLTRGTEVDLPAS
jgi:adenylate cyclase